MKKYLLILSVLFIIVLSACSINNTPTSKVEELLSNYQMLDKSISIDTSLLVTGDVDDSLEQRYKKIIEKQYKNMTYEIKDEKIDGDEATITTEIKVTDFKSIYDKYMPNNYNANEYNNVIINDLEQTKEKITYTVEFIVLKNTKGDWEVENLTTEQTNKLLGIY
jgi:uncharacterized protein YcfL